MRTRTSPAKPPDLEGEDTPSVSVSFYRPFDDLVNTKGAAVDIRLTVNGGEGLRWHYIPTAICPEGLKAVVPAVVGASHEATLVLNLTGAKMKKPHVPVFVTVVAWAFDEAGRLLKTTGTLELQLHRPGLEAERTAQGALKVTLYTDGNLDGVAEKVALKPGQYDCTEEADGSLTIRAKKTLQGQLPTGSRSGGVTPKQNKKGPAAKAAGPFVCASGFRTGRPLRCRTPGCSQAGSPAAGPGRRPRPRRPAKASPVCQAVS